MVKNARTIDLWNLATKADLAAYATRADLQAALADTKVEILKWMVSAIGIQTVVIIGAVIALVRVVPH